MNKSSLLEWTLAEPQEDDDTPDMLPIGNFMQIKKKNEIYSVPCNQCGKPSDGFSCGSKECPFEAPLFI